MNVENKDNIATRINYFHPDVAGLGIAALLSTAALFVHSEPAAPQILQGITSLNFAEVVQGLRSVQLTHEFGFRLDAFLAGAGGIAEAILLTGAAMRLYDSGVTAPIYRVLRIQDRRIIH